MPIISLIGRMIRLSVPWMFWRLSGGKSLFDRSSFLYELIVISLFLNGFFEICAFGFIAIGRRGKLNFLCWHLLKSPIADSDIASHREYGRSTKIWITYRRLPIAKSHRIGVNGLGRFTNMHIILLIADSDIASAKINGPSTYAPYLIAICDLAIALSQWSKIDYLFYYDQNGFIENVFIMFFILFSDLFEQYNIDTNQNEKGPISYDSFSKEIMIGNGGLL